MLTFQDAQEKSLVVRATLTTDVLEHTQFTVETDTARSNI